MILKRIFLILTSGLLILTTAQSCNLPGINLFQNNKVNYTYGILKTDPTVIADGYGFINAVKSGDQTSNDALGSFRTTKFLPYSSDKLFALTKEKGLFVSENAGRFWERKYVYPIDTSSQEKTNESIQRNDDFFIKDFEIRDQRTYFVSGIDSDQKGKIFKSDDSGATFTRVYSEFEEEVSVDLIAIDPRNTNTVYAVLSQGALLKSEDAGRNWSKAFVFKQAPVQLEFDTKLNNTFYALLPKDGLMISNDKGSSWDKVEISKNKSEIGEALPTDDFNLNPLRNDDLFGAFTKIVPITTNIDLSNGKFPALLIADKQAWLSLNVFDSRSFTKIPLPVQSEKNDINDIVYHPDNGVDELIVAVNNQLLTSADGGKSWNVDDNLNLDESIDLGPIYSINFDPNNADIRYLTVSEPYVTERGGLFN